VWLGSWVPRHEYRSKPRLVLPSATILRPGTVERTIRHGAFLKVIDVLGRLTRVTLAGDLVGRCWNGLALDDQPVRRCVALSPSSPAHARPGLEAQKNAGGRQQQQASDSGTGSNGSRLRLMATRTSPRTKVRTPLISGRAVPGLRRCTPPGVFARDHG